MTDAKLAPNLPDWWWSMPTATFPAAAPTGTCTNRPAGKAGHDRTVALADDDRPEVGTEVHLPAVLRQSRRQLYRGRLERRRPATPGWYRNLLANPDVEVQVGTAKMKARARTATGAERARLWEKALVFWPPYADYQRKTEREIPVVVLDPVR